MAHGGMVIGCEHETDAGFANAVFNVAGPISSARPNAPALERSRVRRQSTVAVFGYMTPHAATTSAVAVEIL